MNIDQKIKFASKTLQNGGLVVFPTETVFGLGADALNERSVERVYKVKNRPKDHPLIIHVCSIEMVKKIVTDWNESIEKFVQFFWPGPLTVVLKKNSFLPNFVTAGLDTVAVRIPSNSIALKLLHDFNKIGSGLVAAPSANLFGEVSNTRFVDVKSALKHKMTEEDFFLEGGNCDVGVESTIVDFSSDNVSILRPGGISRNTMEKITGVKFQEIHNKELLPRAPGSHKKHYSPKTSLIVLEKNRIANTILCLQKKNKHLNLYFWGFEYLDIKLKNLKQEIAPDDPLQYAKSLYSKLNELDRGDYNAIIFELPPESIDWEAINDRLNRAKS